MQWLLTHVNVLNTNKSLLQDVVRSQKGPNVNTINTVIQPLVSVNNPNNIEKTKETILLVLKSVLIL